MYNHSATHLMHAALRKVLGTHVQQRGSLVDETRTRFDFSHSQPVTHDEMREVERLVNAEIRRNVPVEANVMHYDDAIKSGAMALFGEKYGDEVRVLRMGEFSTELCGGTHVARTGDIGTFKITSESGVAAGIRRIEAVTAEGAIEFVQAQEEALAAAASSLKAQPQEITQKIAQMIDNVRTLEKEVSRLKSKLATGGTRDLMSDATEVNGIKVLATTMQDADSKVLRETVDNLKDKYKLEKALFVLGAVADGKVTLVAGGTQGLISAKTMSSADAVDFVAKQLGGKGGGRADMAQGGGTDPAKLTQALASVAGWVREHA
jgi:alanyl-tRNA synthetase